MDYEKKLFEENKMNAPMDFTRKTMQSIIDAEEKTSAKNSVKIEYSFMRIGQILVAAAVLLIILNIYPAAKIVQGQDIETSPEQHVSIFRKAANEIGDFFDGIKQTIDFNFFENKGDNNE